MYKDSWLTYTSDRAGGFGRVRTDISRTAFFEGREFRVYKELNIAASGTLVGKIVIPANINIVLYGLETLLDSGWLRLAAYVGGVEGGSFSETLPIFAANGMSGAENRRMDYDANRLPGKGSSVYAVQSVLTAGGTHTGGTELDVSRIKIASNSNQATTVGSVGLDERGVTAGTYYFRFLNLSATDAVTGVFRMRWEERAV
jgi:hypothetical protein